MNAKETNQQACNINAAGCAMLRKNLILHRTKSRGEGTWWTKGHMVDTHKADTRGAQRADKVWKVDTRRIQGGHMADMYMVDKVWGHGQSGPKANTRRTRGGHKAGTRWTKVDTWRTNVRQGLEVGPKRTQGTQGTHGRSKVDTADICGHGLEARPKRTPGGHKADTRRTHGGHKADTWRTHGGQGLEARPKRSQAET